MHTHYQMCKRTYSLFQRFKQHISRQNQTISTEALILHFQEKASKGPLYIYTSCDQMFYKHSVIKAGTLKQIVPTQLEPCFQDIKMLTILNGYAKHVL